MRSEQARDGRIAECIIVRSCPCEMGFRFDASGDGALAWTSSRPDKRFDDDSCVRARVDVANQGAIRFMRTDREAMPYGNDQHSVSKSSIVTLDLQF